MQMKPSKGHVVLVIWVDRTICQHGVSDISVCDAYPISR